MNKNIINRNDGRRNKSITLVYQITTKEDKTQKKALMHKKLKIKEIMKL